MHQQEESGGGGGGRRGRNRNSKVFKTLGLFCFPWKFSGDLQDSCQYLLATLFNVKKNIYIKKALTNKRKV